MSQNAKYCISLFVVLLLLSQLFCCLLYPQHLYFAGKVMNGRKKYGVKYPDLYGDHSTADGKAFNCIQRGAQNAFENISSFHTLLLLSGARYPISASVAAAIYLAGRVMYMQGYATGKPEGRLRGSFMYFGIFAMVGMIGKWSYDLFTS